MQKLRPILLASFFFSLHAAMVAYINSSMLGVILTPKATSALFTVSSALSLVLVSQASSFVQRWGNVRYMLTILTLSVLLLFGIGATSGSWLSIAFFIPYFALNALIYYGLDVFLEHFSSNQTVGNTRGVFLTLNNLAWVGMPALVGMLENRYGFGVVYFFAAFAALAALTTVFVGERHYHDSRYVHISFSKLLFYAWMVIYSPLYLTNKLGLSWESVGFIFSIMLIPFILFQYPAGRIVDKFSNERALIAAGFLIIGVSTLIFSLIGVVPFVVLALILFLTRVGASIVEVANESYFFKQVNDTDTQLIAVFRNMVPLAYLIGPALGVLLLSSNNYSLVFFVLGLLMLGASIVALSLKTIRR
jgi:predicted MFS family arabinose efflux permease